MSLTVWKQRGVLGWGRLSPHRRVLQQSAPRLTKVLVFYCRMQWKWCAWLLYWWTVLWLVCLDRCIACFPRCQQHKQSCLLLLWRWDIVHLLHWMIPVAGITEYKYVLSIKVTQVTWGGRTVHVKILPQHALHFSASCCTNMMSQQSCAHVSILLILWWCVSCST